MNRRLRLRLAAASRGIKAAVIFLARLIGPYEICELAVGSGAYLVARENFGQAPSLGIALIVGAGLACLINLLTDLAHTKHVEGGSKQ